jgi:hypothetical protein
VNEFLQKNKLEATKRREIKAPSDLQEYG